MTLLISWTLLYAHGRYAHLYSMLASGDPCTWSIPMLIFGSLIFLTAYHAHAKK